MALPKEKQEVTDAMLSHLPEATGGNWIKTARSAAMDRLASLGLPVKRDEYWKYGDPTHWTAVEPKFTTTSEASQVFDGVEPLTLVFVDGVFDADASDALALDGAEITLLSKAAQADLHWSQSLYGVLETRANSVKPQDGGALVRPVDRPFAALNTAIAQEGVLIHVTGQVARPIRISYRSNGGQALLHHAVKVDEGASVTLLEEGLPAARYDVMIEADVADEAEFHHVRMQGHAPQVQAMTQLYARLGRESTFKSFALSVDGVATRSDAILELTGDDASAHVGGAVLGDGKDVHHDDTVFITHDAVNCESRQVFKKVLRNGATGVFQGKILVKEDAQKTDGYQISQSLLLDDDSQFLAKPELEIYADDVACSHGSTTGAMDEEGLFYLRARGVPKGYAEDLMTIAFVAEAIDEIADEALQEVVLAQVEAALAGRRG